MDIWYDNLGRFNNVLMDIWYDNLGREPTQYNGFLYSEQQARKNNLPARSQTAIKLFERPLIGGTLDRTEILNCVGLN
jgi:hypothetical protein